MYHVDKEGLTIPEWIWPRGADNATSLVLVCLPSTQGVTPFGWRSLQKTFTLSEDFFLLVQIYSIYTYIKIYSFWHFLSAYWGVRHTFAFLSFLGMAVSYSLRVNLSVALVAMVNTSKLKLYIISPMHVQNCLQLKQVCKRKQTTKSHGQAVNCMKPWDIWCSFRLSWSSLPQCDFVKSLKMQTCETIHKWS